MPTGRRKDDTWPADELEKSVRDAKDERRHTKDRDRDKDRHRDKDRDKDRHRDKDKDRHRDKDRDKERPRDKDRDKDRHRDKDKEHRKDRDEDRRNHGKENGERKHRDKSGERHKSKPRDEDDDRDRRRERRHKDREDEDREKRRERRHRNDEVEDRDKRRERRNRDDEDYYYGSNRHHDEDEKDKRKHKERSSKHRDDDDKDRRHRDKDKHRDEKDDRRHKEREKDDKPRHNKDKDEEEERRRRHEERKERKRREEEAKKREEKEKKKEEDDYGDYEDDFEDYDDDFEDDDKDDDDDEDDDTESKTSSRQNDDDDTSSYASSQKQTNKTKSSGGNSEMDDIMHAMNQENKRLMENSRNKIRDDYEEEPRENARPSTGKRTFINFVSAKQRQMSSKTASKAARRGIELLQMIELDVNSYDMFDMQPVTEYSMYMRSFGSSNTKQAYIQTNDDNIDRDIQTEEIDVSEKWCQHPPADVVSCGGPDDKASVHPDDMAIPQLTPHLTEFVEKAGQVITILMEEEYLDKLHQDQPRSKQSNIIVSDAFSELTMPDFLKARPVIFSHFSPVQTHMLLTVHKTSKKQSSDSLSRVGCLCVWNINEPSRPQKILTCESRPRCCCFSPTKTSLVFAGMLDGSVVVWDLREQASLHKVQPGLDLVLRYPTYNTAGVLHYENHGSAVVSVQPIVAPGESASASLDGLTQSESGEGLSFQLASLEENGTIHLWVVAELSHSDLAGSESDFGLSPGGKVKLVKSSTIQLESPLRDTRVRTTMKCVDMQLLPSNNSHYYVASDTGCVVHGLRYGGKALPKAYRPVVENVVQITSIDFSPFTEPIFLAGCEDGSLRLYHVDNEWPLISWPMSTGGRVIQHVCWCRSRPSVFFVLDTESRLYIWDLLMDDSGPLKQEIIAQNRVLNLALSNDHSATGLGLPGRRPQMVVCLDNGVCEIHVISQQFSALMSDEMDQFNTFLKKNG